MESLWQDSEAQKYQNDPLEMRVYTSRLLGQDPDLVLHGGGNTSVKASVNNIFGEAEEIIYVKGSGWDLATIEAPGFAPVKMEVLLKLAALPTLTDSDMVSNQRAAMTNPNAPNPSVEAILHALIPFKFVDHTHTDAVVTITNTPDGEARIKEVYGDSVLYIPYIMPGFVLARKVWELTQGKDWNKYEGMVLLNHGLFTFDNDAKASYEKMIKLVSMAEDYLEDKGAVIQVPMMMGVTNPIAQASIRKEVSKTAGRAMLARHFNDSASTAFSNRSDVSDIANRGPLTPDHVIRTKRTPLLLTDKVSSDLAKYTEAYSKYYNENKWEGLTMLDPAPRWGLWPKYGRLSFGKTAKELRIIGDITEHTVKAIQQAEVLGGWNALPAKDIFDVEYWELEQAKLRKGGKAPQFQGKVALVTGAASGIGKACVEALLKEGACVAALDINQDITTLFDNENVLGITCDVTDNKTMQAAIASTVQHYGGIDILISNAGTFPPSASIEEMNPATWQHSMNLNLNAHQALMQMLIPFLKQGIDPAIVIVGSKNVPAPGPGAAAYSVAKAGLNQLARVAALELAPHGVRVNSVHPDAVFDTGVWTDEILSARAKHYGLTVEEYKTKNLLKTEITSQDVASLIVAMAGKVFSKTTGAQVPIDGGNDRVI